MRRSRTLLIVLLVIVVVVILGVVAYRVIGGLARNTTATPTPSIRYVDVIIAGQNINPGPQITEAMLSTMRIPETNQVAGYITDRNAVIGKFAKIAIQQGWPVMSTMLSDTPGISELPGSPWSSQIPQRLTAISIPITRLSSVGFGIRDNDFVNVIVTMLVVDVDASFQTKLPNQTAVITGAGALPESLPILTIDIGGGGNASTQGRTEMDPTLNNAVYVVPSESQRPRMVAQMIMQNIQVLHVGNFALAADSTTSGTPKTATPTPAGQTQTTQITKPDIITLLVNPQDAVVLTYLMYSGAQITLTLRNPADFDYITTTDAATLQYLLSQYNIPVPAKLPYSLQPRTDELTPPSLPNDAVVVPAQ